VWRGRAQSGLDECLAAADALVVRGDDAQLLAEAAASGKPVYIHPARDLGAGRWRVVRHWIERRAHRRPTNRRGTPRPQQGLEYLCARLIERGFVAPVPDLRELHQALHRRGIALPFGAPLDPSARPPLRDTPAVARRVEEVLGHPAGAGPSGRS
jgi:mitochondrial fission protein ELM1